ncbi:MAG: hypothetical protein MZV65_19205 [Chromatiales bacterium]|nr:hypothetical protein [Chromatiales bacterium]
MPLPTVLKGCAAVRAADDARHRDPVGVPGHRHRPAGSAARAGGRRVGAPGADRP